MYSEIATLSHAVCSLLAPLKPDGAIARDNFVALSIRRCSSVSLVASRLAVEPRHVPSRRSGCIPAKTRHGNSLTIDVHADAIVRLS